MQSQLKILFVDDHVGLRDGMTQMLKNKDSSFDFVCASDYEGALETLKENQDIKIVILDNMSLIVQTTHYCTSLSQSRYLPSKNPKCLSFA